MDSGAERPNPPGGPGRRMTVDERLAIIRSGLDRYGEGFLAYLMLDGTDQSDPDMVERFTLVYAGWYPDRAAFVTAHLDSLDWSWAVDRFTANHGLTPGTLRFNTDAVWNHLREVYAVEERLGGVHVFTT